MSTARDGFQWGHAVIALFVLAVVAAGIVGVLALRDDDGEPDGRMSFALSGTPGEVRTEKLGSGWRIELDAELPRLDGGEFYEAWLRNDAGTLVPIGTFNEGDDVVLWAGVSPLEFTTFTVTREMADGDQASSGERVLMARLILK